MGESSPSFEGVADGDGLAGLVLRGHQISVELGAIEAMLASEGEGGYSRRDYDRKVISLTLTARSPMV